MDIKHNNNIHDLLVCELSESTPANIEMCKAAWSGVSLETKMEILFKFKKDRNLPKDILDLALESENPFIRYLAASAFHSFNDYEINELNQKIKNDSSELVQNAQSENFYLFLSPYDKYIKEILSSSKNKRAILFHGMNGTTESIITLSLEFIRSILEADLDKDEVIEFIYLLGQNKNYMNSIANLNRHGFYNDSNLEKNIIFILNKLSLVTSAVAIGISKIIPIPDIGNTDQVEEILYQIPVECLNEILARKNFYFSKFRKKIFFSDNSEYSETAKFAARYNLDLDSQDLYLIFTSDNRKTQEKLKYIQPDSLRFAIDLYRVNEFVHSRDLLGDYNNVWHDSRKIDDLIKEKIIEYYKVNRHDEHGIYQCLHQISTFQFVLAHVNAKTTPEEFNFPYYLDEKFQILKECLVPGKPFETYFKFREIISSNECRAKKSDIRIEYQIYLENYDELMLEYGDCFFKNSNDVMIGLRNYMSPTIEQISIIRSNSTRIANLSFFTLIFVEVILILDIWDRISVLF